jgi:hypothetical protein
MTSPAITRPNTQRSHRSAMQRRAERSLAEHPYRVELTGGLSSLAWPAICANCGGPTSERLTVRKVFLRPRYRGRRRRGVTRYHVTAAQIPYCAACGTRHRDLTPHRSLSRNVLGIIFTPLLIPIVGSIIMGTIALRAVRGISPSEPHALLAWGVPALFLAICLWSLLCAWEMTRADRVERQSDVTMACDFSDDVSWFFERQRRIYALRNETFARALADANRDRVWTPDDDRRSSRLSLIVVVVGIGVAVWAAVVLGAT